MPGDVAERVAGLEAHRVAHEDRHARFEDALTAASKERSEQIAALSAKLDELVARRQQQMRELQAGQQELRECILANGQNGRRRRRDLVGPVLEKGGVAGAGAGAIYLLLEVLRRLSVS